MKALHKVLNLLVNKIICSTLRRWTKGTNSAINAIPGMAAGSYCTVDILLNSTKH